MATQRWNIDHTHSVLGFHVRHLMIANVHGRFHSWDGEIDYDPDDPERSRVEIRVDAASIDTRDPKRDDHLRSSEFLAVDAFPAITFASTRVERVTLDDYEVVGDLTIHGITRKVILDVTRSVVIVDPAGNLRAGFVVAGHISRKDFGLTWNVVLEAGGVMVGDRVTFAIEMEVVRLPESRQPAAVSAAK